MECPILIYDNSCGPCTRYARCVDAMLGGRITMVGHHTAEGRALKSRIFPDGYGGEEMSWFVDSGMAHGGRSGLLRLLSYMLKAPRLRRPRERYPKNVFDSTQCEAGCDTAGGAVQRARSLLCTGRTITVPKGAC